MLDINRQINSQHFYQGRKEVGEEQDEHVSEDRGSAHGGHRHPQHNISRVSFFGGNLECLKIFESHTHSKSKTTFSAYRLPDKLRVSMEKWLTLSTPLCRSESRRYF